ncbi:hypothetical protein F441_14550 [Phytophthora nicotianae CJ01A1]|uniref:Uncharacterized protein n=5 Tax=Phytophthora nicotianae TaxID=4792 RepID=W2PWR9_PHYN3|nr:hypothetical protein PPTG_23616 [Phytophthora nicotianae INRA-310]ETI39771.1 hypothetical protein F443_14689 [Phytophthora nicotianae P1569]ETK79873.1 hypothetical protein L915_14312 [Phytophthora nicotianae]ETO68431.1 hypothetical protein F444_14697 [Phytophthora nicotianae P1976]ETP09561.1 hypothetical protein F441_14550 [Phytophthora nicotianae CJ01A1]ETL33292.1 hypothetical protein L916_14218 [Phytophthora nicotianae]
MSGANTRETLPYEGGALPAPRAPHREQRSHLGLSVLNPSDHGWHVPRFAATFSSAPDRFCFARMDSPHGSGRRGCRLRFLTCSLSPGILCSIAAIRSGETPAAADQ